MSNNERTCKLTGEVFHPADGNRRMFRSNAARNRYQHLNDKPYVKTELTAGEVDSEKEANQSGS